MPRNESEPEAAAAAPRRLHLWRRKEMRGQNSLDSDDGLLGELPSSLGTSPVVHVAPASKASSHESGSLSDLEDHTVDTVSQTLPALSFSKFRLGARRDKSLPPQPESARKPHGKVDGAKPKGPRVNRLREFTERFRRTDLRWSREEKPPPATRSLPRAADGAAAPPAPPPAAGASDRPLLRQRHGGQPPIGENRDAAEPGGRSLFRAARSEGGLSLRGRPASDSDLAWESAPPPAAAPAAACAPGPLGQPRTIPFRSASFSRVDSCGADATQCALTIQPVAFSINRAAGRPGDAQTLPKALGAAGRGVEVGAVAAAHARQKSDSLVELGRMPPPPADEDAMQRDSLLLEAMLREIQQQSLSLQERDRSGDGWPGAGGAPARPTGRSTRPASDSSRGEAGLARGPPAGDRRSPNEGVAPANVSGAGEKSANEPNASSATGAVGRGATSLRGSVDEAARRASPATDGGATAVGRPGASVAATSAVGERRRALENSADVTSPRRHRSSSAGPLEPRYADLSPVITTHSPPIGPVLLSQGRATADRPTAGGQTGPPQAALPGHGESAALHRSCPANLQRVDGGQEPNGVNQPADDRNVTQETVGVESVKPVEQSSEERSRPNLAPERNETLPNERSPQDEETKDTQESRESQSAAYPQNNEDIDKSPAGTELDHSTVNDQDESQSSKVSKGTQRQPKEVSESSDLSEWVHVVSSKLGSIVQDAHVTDDNGQLPDSSTKDNNKHVPDVAPKVNRVTFKETTVFESSKCRSERSQLLESPEFNSKDQSGINGVSGRSTSQLRRQNATGANGTVGTRPGSENLYGECSSDLRVTPEDALKLSLDHGETEIDPSADKENIRQAVKKAVQLLLNELNVDEDQEDPWFPPASRADPSETPEELAERDDPLHLPELSVSFGPQPESKTVDVVRFSDHSTTLAPALGERKSSVLPSLRRRFRSKSLSPLLPRHGEVTAPGQGDGEDDRQASASSRPLFRSRLRRMHHKHRSFDLAGPAADERPPERRRSLKQRHAAALSPSTDSVSSSSSDELRARGQPHARSGAERRPKLHAPRARTVSDSATLRPLSSSSLLLPLTEQTAALPGRRDASPSPLAYDSEPDGPGRGGRRRLRGPYGELLEGKMTRAELTPLGALAEAAARGEAPPAERAPPAGRRSRLVATSGSESELVEPAAEADAGAAELAEFAELLTDELYDGVGPTADSLIAQLTAQQGRNLRDRPGKQGRRIFIIGELLDTEQLYVDSLRLLVEHYQKLRSPELSALIDQNALLDIFHMVPEILEIHEDFLMELNARTENWTAEQCIGEVFLNKLTHGAVLDTYTAFVNNWPAAREALLRSCQAKPELAKFLEALERSNKRKLSLSHLLIMPVQRIPRYELLLKQLVAHTPVEHPDLEPLRGACSEVHQLASRINRLQRATMRVEAQQQVLRDLEAAVDGLDGLVTSDREFLRQDVVSLMTSTGVKKERCLFLFSDLLVIASVKRRAGSNPRKQATSLNVSSPNGLEPNKYKFLMKVPLSDISIARGRAEDPNVLMKEVERIDEDISTLRQMGVLVCKLHSNHHQVEELVREMAHVLNRELTERHRADSLLLQLPLHVTSEEGSENITVSFCEVEKRVTWEQLFNQTKQKHADLSSRQPVPRFLYPIPVRKTRAGLQFTCAAPTLDPLAAHGKDVWVCNSDGYVGQICTLSLQPEPTVTSCNGVCNSRILCMAPIPPPSDSETSMTRPTKSPSRSPRGHHRRPAQHSGGRGSPDSSSESDSSDESKCDLSRGVADESMCGELRGATDESKPSRDQPTMWLGTEDGCVYVYNCSDYVRVKKTTVKVQLGAAVHALAYLADRVFAGLSNGAVSAFRRTAGGFWDIQHPQIIQVSANPINKLASVFDKLWVCTNNLIKVVDPHTDRVEETVAVSSSSQTAVQSLVHAGLGVWLSFLHTAKLRLFHATTFDMVCEVDVTSAVTRMLSGCDDIIRQHKTACLRVTSLMACKSLLWIGTSAGVILNLPLPPLSSNTSWINSTLSIAGISHGHTGYVRFLVCVTSAATNASSPHQKRRHRRNGVARSEDRSDGPGAADARALVISGGDGYEDFRSSGVELSGRDDSTNHLLLWDV